MATRKVMILSLISVSHHYGGPMLKIGRFFRFAIPKVKSNKSSLCNEARGDFVFVIKRRRKGAKGA
jgi:hypothetical protein